MVQFFISVVAMLLFAAMPSGRMFGDPVAGKSRKYLASQMFTASYPRLEKKNQRGAVVPRVWVQFHGELPLLSFNDPGYVLTSMFLFCFLATRQ
jgi:1,3-beta-glucan synthase